jgi:hypothetical protein
MSNEPEKNIEQRLHEYAQQRQAEAGAPLELHPVTRKLLQDEVARTLAPAAPAEETAASAGWLARFWPRLSLSSALAATCVFVIFAVVMDARLKRETQSATYGETSFGRELQLAAVDKDARGAAPIPAELANPATTSASATAPAKADARAEGSLPMRAISGAATAPEGRMKELATKPGTPDLRADAHEVSAGQKFTPADQNRAIDEAVDRQKLAAAAQEKKLENFAGRDLKAREESLDRAGKLQMTERDADGIVRGFKDTTAGAGGAAPPVAQLAPAPSQPLAELAKAKVAQAPKSNVNAFGLDAAGGAGVANAPAAPAPDDAGFANATALQFKATAPAPTRRNYNSPPFPKVLTSFRLELAGNRVRITDADGSVYEGQLEAPGTETETRAQQSLGGVRGRTENGVPFEAKGVNRTLNQQVSFRGNVVLAPTPEPSDPAARGRAAGGARPAVGTGAAFADAELLRAGRQLQSTQVRGRVTVGRSQYDLQAVTPP